MQAGANSISGISFTVDNPRRFTHVPYQRVGPSVIPDFDLPYTTTLSPHLDASRREVVDWAARMGMLEPQPGVPASHIWDARKLAGYDFPLCAAGLHPDATPEQLDIGSCWLTWGTYGDDYYPVVFGRPRDLLGAKVCNDRLLLFMPLDCSPTPPPANALERGLADLWARTAGPMDAGGRALLHRTLVDMTDSWLWELANQAQNRIPEPVDYMEMRRHTFGAHFTMSLSRFGHGKRVPQEIYASGPMQNLENAAADYSMLMNDVFSYQKEIEYEGEVHNAILVVQNFFDCDYPAALGIVDDLMRSRMSQFQHVVAHELPVLYDEFGLDREVRDILDGYVEELKNWMAGILVWHRDCRRYRQEDLSHGPLPEPSGLGMEVVRPGWLRELAAP